MKVCFISSYPPPTIGIATYTAELCSALVKQGVKITVLSNTGTPDNHKIRVMKAWSEKNFMYPLRLFKQVASGNFDIIHIQHEYWLYGRGMRSLAFLLLLALLKFTMKPIIITMHCIVPYTKLTREFFRKHGLGVKTVFIKRLYVLLYNKLICLFASKIIVHSTIARNVLINDYSFKRGKVTVIYHGTCSKIYRSGTKTGKSSPILLIFGEIRRGKGIEYAINAMPYILGKFPSCTLIVAGIYDPNMSPESKGYLSELKELVKNLDLENNVKFRVNISDEEVQTLFEETDLAIFPYIEDEIIAASGPLLTAIGYGKPIIATSVRRFRDYIENGINAIIVPPADSLSLAKAILLLLNNSVLKEKLSKSSSELANLFDWSKIARKTLALYSELIT